MIPPRQSNEEFRKQARRRWVQLIKKVYEIDPLICKKCGGKMAIISFITEADVIRKILKHIGQYDPPERTPPAALVIRPPVSSVPSSEREYFPEEHIP